MTVTAITVADMHCGACQSKIRRALVNTVDNAQVQFNPVRRQVLVDHPDELSSTKLLESIESAGFSPVLENSTLSTPAAGPDRTLLKRLGVAGLAAMQVMMLHIALYAGALQGMEHAHQRLLEFAALLFCIPVVCYSAVPFFTRALSGLSINPNVGIRLTPNMDTPIALAIAIAFGVSFYRTLNGGGDVYYDSVVMFTFLLLGARYLDFRLRERLHVEDNALASLPRTVMLWRDGQTHAIPADQVTHGNVLWIGQGEQIPVDGALISEQAIIEQSMLTGESDWQQLHEGARLYAGTFNQGAAILLRADTDVGASRLAQIVDLANQAQLDKQGLTALADRVAQVFIPAILALAALTYTIWHWIEPSAALSAALAVLVVSCPCALSLATPAALTAAQTRLRQLGVLVRHSTALERAARICDVFFDKTGTLTHPDMMVVNQQSVGTFAIERCLSYAAALQRHSSHPLASAFITTNGDTTPTVSEVRSVTGHGIEGSVQDHWIQLGSAEFCGFSDRDQPPVQDASLKRVYMSIDRQPCALFDVGYQLRDDAQSAVLRLKQQGLTPHMLSGDQPDQCARVADLLDMPFTAQALPEDKYRRLADRQANAGGSLYVGDGINDLPVLASADISAATLETNDLVKSKADLVLLTRRLGSVADFFVVARHTRQVMKQNLMWAAAYNVIAVPLAASGFAPPWVAALGMSLSSLLVMGNASRLLKTKVS